MIRDLRAGLTKVQVHQTRTQMHLALPKISMMLKMKRRVPKGLLMIRRGNPAREKKDMIPHKTKRGARLTLQNLALLINDRFHVQGLKRDGPRFHAHQKDLYR